MRVVLDTNIIIISLSEFSDYHKIFSSLIDKKYELLISNDILLEYSEIAYRKYSRRTTDFLVSFLLNALNVIKVDPEFKWNLIDADPDDNKFADCALSGRADFIVTNDKHFSILKSVDFPKINVINAEDFIKLLMKKE